MNTISPEIKETTTPKTPAPAPEFPGDPTRETDIKGRGKSVLVGRKSFLAAATMAGAAVLFRSKAQAQTATGRNAPWLDVTSPEFAVNGVPANGSDEHDDTLQIQKALDAVDPDFGGTVYFPPGRYFTNQPLVPKPGTRLVGASQYRCQIVNVTENVFDMLEDYAHYLSFEGLHIVGANGHILNVFDYTFLTVKNCVLEQRSPTHSALNVSYELIDSCFENLEIYHVVDSTVPTFNLVSYAGTNSQLSNGGAINSNLFRKIRFNNVGHYCFWLEDRGTGTHCFDNILEQFTCEMAYGGLVKILSCMNTIIRQCVLWDFPATDITNDLFHVGKSPMAGSQPSVFTRIEQCGRRNSGAMQTGLVDIRLQPAASMFTVIDQYGCASLQHANTCIIDAGCQYPTFENAGVTIKGCPDTLKILNYEFPASARFADATVTRVTWGPPDPAWNALNGTMVVDGMNNKLYIRINNRWATIPTIAETSSAPDFNAPAPDGAMVIDNGNGRLWVRMNGSWKSTLLG